jgi:hypothetical protein
MGSLNIVTHLVPVFNVGQNKHVITTCISLCHHFVEFECCKRMRYTLTFGTTARDKV